MGWIQLFESMVLGVVLLVILFILISRNDNKAEKRELAEWKKYAICDCSNFREQLPFDSLFHLHKEVCPSCGENKYRAMSIAISRCIDGKWEDKDVHRDIRH